MLADPFGVVLVAEFSNQGIGYLLGSAGLTIDPASSGIASVLVFGAATDYALLLVARYREELRFQADSHRAMRLALSSAGPTIVASALTVAAALLTLLLCTVGGTQAIGPLAATGVLAAMLLTLTLLPALLLIVGRRAFWPLIPRAGSGTVDDVRDVWGRVGRHIERRPRRVWTVGLAVLAVLAVGLTQLTSSLGSGGEFLRKPEAVRGGELLAKAFPAGTASPTDVIVPDRAKAAVVRRALQERDGIVATVAEPQFGPPGARLTVVLRAEPRSTRAEDQIPALRAAVAAASPTALIGGPTAEAYDLREASKRDTRVVVPVALAVVLLILISSPAPALSSPAPLRSLAVLPLVVLAQLGFVIGIGVLLDTLVVRSLIVPALIYDLAHRVWWPSRLDRPAARKEAEHAEHAGNGPPSHRLVESA